MAKFFAELKRRNIYRVGAVCAVVAGCATPNSELPYYELPSSDGASVRPAIIEGTLEQFRRRSRVCAYVFSIDGQTVGDRADCTAAVPISPGKHTIATSLDGNQYFFTGSRNFNFYRATATLMFDVEEGHHYKISLDRVYFGTSQLRAHVWVEDATAQTPVTEATLVTSPMPLP